MSGPGAGGTGSFRSHMCGELRAADAGSEVRLAGWVHRRRDHGGVIFIDLRDREGLVQVVLHPAEQAAAYPVAEKLRSEFVVSVKGRVRLRPEGTENPALPTGEVEVAAAAIEILAESETPPFLIDDRTEAGEDVRLRYRYLDLRRPEMQRMLRLRHRVVSAIRSHFDEAGFLEVETPMLTRSTPEGARDFLVPSRLSPGTFFALPQSPQLFKQLLVVGGVDRYFQVVRCFRDEDPRADRQPEFTQLDAEMAFGDEASVRSLIEGMFVRVFREGLGVELTVPFDSMTYAESMERYGTDRPDMRFGLPITDVTEVFGGTELQVFRGALDAGGAVKCIAVPGAAGMARKQIDELVGRARELGAAGLAWVGFQGGGINSPLAKAMSAEEPGALRSASQAGDGDLVLLVAGEARMGARVLGALRAELAARLSLIPASEPADPAAWRFVWITDPPLVAWNADESRWDPVHHPFTSPAPGSEELLEEDPGAVQARAYDIVLNGWELGGGSVRVHRPGLQRRIFDLIGITPEDAERRFGWFVRAFDYGAPPHAGIALGIDRIVAMMGGKSSIREAIAFPKTSAFTDLLTGAPDRADPAQLAELKIKTAPPGGPDEPRR